MTKSRFTRLTQRTLSNRRLACKRAIRTHVIKPCRIYFGNGNSVNRERAIAGLRNLANHMDRDELVLNKNLYPTHITRVVSEARSPNVFMGFDSDPLHALPEWLEFQPKYKGKNAPLIENIFHQSPAGMLIFATEQQGAKFVHLHETNQGRNTICTSQVCFQEYQAKESDKKQRQKQNIRANGSTKRKRDTQNDEFESQLAERKRMKCHQKTFKALCEAWKTDYNTRKKLLFRPIYFQDLPLDLKLIIWDFAILPRTVVVNPCIISEPGSRKTLRIESCNTNHALFYVNRQSRYSLLKHNSLLRISDTSGPTGLLIDGEKDSVYLLALGFLRTRSLQDYDRIAQPFSKIQTISFPWTSAGFSAHHVASMPSIFGSLQSLALLAFEDEISQVNKLAHNWVVAEVPEDFQYAGEMIERKKWIEDAFFESGRNIDVQLRLLKDIKKEANRLWERQYHPTD